MADNKKSVVRPTAHGIVKGSIFNNEKNNFTPFFKVWEGEDKNLYKFRIVDTQREQNENGEWVDSIYNGNKIYTNNDISIRMTESEMEAMKSRLFGDREVATVSVYVSFATKKVKDTWPTVLNAIQIDSVFDIEPFFINDREIVRETTERGGAKSITFMWWTLKRLINAKGTPSVPQEKVMPKTNTAIGLENDIPF